MTEHEFDDETLMAFADGELDAATAARLEAALERNEALAGRLAVFLGSRMAVASALKPLVHEPVPDALMASVRRMAETIKPVETAPDSNVVAFSPKEAPPAASGPRPWLMPVAASLLAAIAGFGGFTLGRSTGPTAQIASSGGTALASALDREGSGHDISLDASGQSLHVVSSFRDEGGDLCREYELKHADGNTISIACRKEGAWVTRLALSAPQTEGYTPASAQETIDAYLVSIHAGAPLSPDEERAALAGLR